MSLSSLIKNRPFQTNFLSFWIYTRNSVWLFDWALFDTMTNNIKGETTMIKWSVNWLRSEKRQKYQGEWCFSDIFGSRKDAFSGRYSLVKEISVIHLETTRPFCICYVSAIHKQVLKYNFSMGKTALLNLKIKKNYCFESTQRIL